MEGGGKICFVNCIYLFLTRFLKSNVFFIFIFQILYAMAARQDLEDIPLLNPERAGKMMQAVNEFDGVANEFDGMASTCMRRAAELI
jgi:hypothetical protein